MSGPTPLQQRILKVAEMHDEQWRRDNAVPLRQVAELRERGGSLPPEAVEALKPRSVEDRQRDVEREAERGF